MDKMIPSIKEKIAISGQLVVVTGLHIGTSGDFSPIGAVDSVIIRDPVSRQPIIPGSSIKGKMRSLLAAVETEKPWLPDIAEESDILSRLFGQGGKAIRRSRLQFYDLFISTESIRELEQADTDLYLTEIKFENFINRINSVANPRQLERVPAGTRFEFRLMYTVEDPDQFVEDMELLAKGLMLLQLDYLGQGGSRGNGRIRFENLDLETKLKEQIALDLDSAREVLNRAIQS